MTTEEIKRRKYQHNNISNVIFAVNFPKILDLRKPTAEFQKIIIEKFPIMKEVNLDNVQFNLQPSEEPQTEYEREIAWEFTNKERNRKVFVSSIQIILEYFNNSYRNFEEFAADVETVFEAVINLYPVKVAERIGLRYINQIEIKGENNVFNWSNLINSNLYTLTHEFTSKEDKVLRSMHFLELNENNHSLKFQFGLFNSDYPSPIRRKEFILDYDCSTTQNRDITDIFDILNEFHEIEVKWFEKSIDKGLRERMGVSDES
ncbi:TIGR04255 family protein [Methanobacterium sp. CWC-01]|uniref:TIGR04255 family protein n=1 Tax=Methanobacterium aridiramus TaxID=2584467 RepID=UPI002578057B|nr:TIGR04255 family protein [Methanobacterium sp. CWC-01]